MLERTKLADDDINITEDQQIRSVCNVSLFIHSFINGSTALCWAVASFFQFLDPVHSR
jgi:hypothetical protein